MGEEGQSMWFTLGIGLEGHVWGRYGVTQDTQGLIQEPKTAILARSKYKVGQAVRENIIMATGRLGVSVSAVSQDRKGTFRIKEEQVH